MKYELRRIVPSLVISLALIRLWIEVTATTVLKNSNIVTSVNNSGWFHHYQLGLVLILVVIFVKKFFKDKIKYLNVLEGFSIALIVDQYTYLLELIGVVLPFEYRSVDDYLITAAAALLLGIWYFFTKRNLKFEFHH